MLTDCSQRALMRKSLVYWSFWHSGKFSLLRTPEVGREQQDGDGFALAGVEVRRSERRAVIRERLHTSGLACHVERCLRTVRACLSPGRSPSLVVTVTELPVEKHPPESLRR